jgi:hypothetical protein
LTLSKSGKDAVKSLPKSVVDAIKSGQPIQAKTVQVGFTDRQIRDAVVRKRESELPNASSRTIRKNVATADMPRVIHWLNQSKSDAQREASEKATEFNRLCRERGIAGDQWESHPDLVSLSKEFYHSEES